MLAWAAIQAGGSSSVDDPATPPADEPIPDPGPIDPLPPEDGGPSAGTSPGATGPGSAADTSRVPTLGEIRARLEEGKREDALGGLDRLLAADPDNREARLLRGRTYRSLNWNRFAEADFRELLASGEETSPVLEELAEVLQGTRIDEAQRLLLRSIELSPNRARPHSLLARIHLRSGRTAQAKDEVEKALTLDATDSLAVALMEQLKN